MNTSKQIARHLRDVYFGGNWTSVNYQQTLADVTWEQAISKVHSFNTIAVLVFHTNYYISAVTRVLQGHPLDASDKFSFDVPALRSQEDWLALLNKSWAEAEIFAALIEQLPEQKLWEDFSDPKYGNYYRNLTGIIEHLHYHLGQ